MNPDTSAEERPVIELAVGEQVRLYPERMPTYLSCTDPEVALCGAILRSVPILIQGLKPGTTDLLIQYGDAHVELIDISVHRDLSALQHTLSSLVGASPPGGKVPLSVPLGATLTIELPRAPTLISVEDGQTVKVSKP